MKKGKCVKIRSLKSRNERKPTIEQEEIAKAYIALLKACAEQKDLRKAATVCADIGRSEFLERNVFVRNTVISMYAKCGALEQAKQVLESYPNRDVVSWSALIAGYAQHGNAREALYCYEQMQSEDISINAITCMSILRACGNVCALRLGEKIHEKVVQDRFLEKNALIGSALISMYCKCGALEKALTVLEGLPFCDMDSWSALISGYAQAGLVVQACDCLDRMQEDCLSPTIANFSCILKACGHIGAYEKGKHIHGKIIVRGLLESCKVLGGALVDMYCKLKALAEATSLLISIPHGDVISWSAVITGYVQDGQGKEALDSYDRMHSKGLIPNAITFACVLKACANLGALEKGQQVHIEISRQGFLCSDAVLGGALIDMYAKCGALAKAQEAIVEVPLTNVVSWTALIAGYARKGSLDGVLSCCQRMQCDGISPNSVTFMSILSACSHAGLLKTGQTWFDKMSYDYGIVPSLEHNACMVDLFSRTGLFDEVIAMIDREKCSSHLPVWSTLLGACQKWGNVKLARWAFHHALMLDRKDASAYVCMCSILKDASLYERESVSGLKMYL